jgi:hypothetical protein
MIAMTCCSIEMKLDQHLLVKGENIYKDLKGVNPWLLNRSRALKDNVVDVSAAHGAEKRPGVASGFLKR